MTVEEPFASLPDEARQQLQQESHQPDWMEPMLATLTHEYFFDPGWIYERKMDGERCLVFRDGDSVRLLSRNRHEMNTQYPELAEALAGLEEEKFIVDGEVVAFEDGLTSFERLQDRINISGEEEARQSDVDVYLYVFDILHLRHHEMTRVPLRQRKQLLKSVFSFSDPIRYVAHRSQEGEKFFKEACEKGWEGIVAKNGDSTYVHGRSRHWLKFKCVRQQEFVIGGYTEPHGERGAFGALLLGYQEGERLRYAGKVGTGFDDETLRALHGRLASLERKAPPFDDEGLPRDEVHWVTPVLVAEIGFEEWTQQNRLRQPRYLGLRRDKAAEEVVKES